ncbi:MAG: aquaporin [Actinomycetota bacterium]
MSTTRLLAAELIGTFLLMLGGPGTAVFAGDRVGVLGISLGFGLALLIAAYTVGPISGCHINPAVTLGMTLAGKLDRPLAPYYLGGQLLGALLGGFTIWVIRNGAYDDFEAAPDTFATNLWGAEHGFYNFGAMVVAEVVLTGVLVLAVLGTTRRGFPPAATGVTVGLTLTLIHLISIPIDNTSVNPARSFGTALYAGGAAIEQLWAFVLFPLIGAGLGVLVWSGLEGIRLAPADGPAAAATDDEVVDLTDAPAPEEAPVDPETVPAAMGAATAPGTVKLRHPYGPGSHAVLDEPGTMPEGYPVKGEVDSLRYRGPDDVGYDDGAAEVWFDTPESAESAGFTRAED